MQVGLINVMLIVFTMFTLLNCKYSVDYYHKDKPDVIYQGKTLDSESVAKEWVKRLNRNYPNLHHYVQEHCPS